MTYNQQFLSEESVIFLLSVIFLFVTIEKRVMQCYRESKDFISFRQSAVASSTISRFTLELFLLHYGFTFLLNNFVEC